jgi:hypothetical protein
MKRNRHHRMFGYWFYEELRGLVAGQKDGKKQIAALMPDSMRVNTGGLRLRCLARSPICVVCEREGVMWVLESFSGETPHLNLYALACTDRTWPARPGLILMTKDHIVPSSRGGEDALRNLQTMCAPCNNAKGSQYPLPPDWMEKRRAAMNKQGTK